jgi:hypothetical protein
MISMDTRDPKKAALSAELAEAVAEWEAKHGPIVTIPCGNGAPVAPFSITTKGGVAKRNPDKPTNLDMEDGE